MLGGTVLIFRSFAFRICYLDFSFLISSNADFSVKNKILI